MVHGVYPCVYSEMRSVKYTIAKSQVNKINNKTKQNKTQKCIYIS